MKYAHRWGYSALIVLGLFIAGYCYDLGPQLASLDKAMQTEKALRQKVILMKQEMKSTVNHEQPLEMLTYTQPELIALLLQKSRISGVMVQSVSVVSVSLIRLHAQANYHQVSTFFAALAVEAVPMYIHDFSLQQTSGDQLQIKLDIAILPYVLGRTLFGKLVEARALSNPLCLAEVVAVEVKNKPQLYPLAEMKMLGYVEQHNHKIALILLPDTSVIDVGLHAILGVEHAEIIEMSEGGVRLSLPTGQARYGYLSVGAPYHT